jgi:hypothetical protein
MKTALEIVSEACRAFGLAAPKSLADQSNANGRLLLSGLNRTAEELSIEHNWLVQTKLKTFTLDTASTYYNASVGGYDLDKLTDGTFEKFTGSYLYNITDTRQIPGLVLDKFQKDEYRQINQHGLSYFRTGKYLIFLPNISGKDIQFYYQTKNIASSLNGSIETEVDIITSDPQIPFHDARLLLRGVMVYYARFSKFDTAEYVDTYNKYKEKMIAQEIPKSAFGQLSGYANVIGRFPNLV